jgi:hypothetical protein
MTLKFHRDAAMNIYRGVLQGGIDNSLDFIAMNAAKRAPVRKQRSAKHTAKAEAVKVTRENYIPDSTRYATSEGQTGNTRLVNYPVSSVPIFQRNRRSGLDKQTAANKARTNRGVGKFTFKFVGARSGTETGNIGYDPVRGKVTAKPAVRGGNLKSKIRRTQVEIDGNRVSGSVVSGAPYSVYVEGVKRGHGAPQPFFRPAIADYKGHWRAFFKDGR